MPASNLPASDFDPPLAPRPTLFRVLSIAVGLWIAALIVLYIFTVRPMRKPLLDVHYNATTAPNSVAK